MRAIVDWSSADRWPRSKGRAASASTSSSPVPDQSEADWLLRFECAAAARTALARRALRGFVQGVGGFLGSRPRRRRLCRPVTASWPSTHPPFRPLRSRHHLRSAVTLSTALNSAHARRPGDWAARSVAQFEQPLPNLGEAAQLGRGSPSRFGSSSFGPTPRAALTQVAARSRNARERRGRARESVAARRSADGRKTTCRRSFSCSRVGGTAIA